MKIGKNSLGYYEVNPENLIINQKVLTKLEIDCAKFSIIFTTHDQMYRQEQENKLGKLYGYDCIAIDEEWRGEYLYIKHIYARQGTYFFIEKKEVLGLIYRM